MEYVGDRHHKHCLSRMTASSKQSIKIKKRQTSIGNYFKHVCTQKLENANHY